MSTQLIEAVLKWWEEHQHDTVASEEDEWNVYDEPPEFVRLALASQPAEQPRGEAVASSYACSHCHGSGFGPDGKPCPVSHAYYTAQPKPEQATTEDSSAVREQAGEGFFERLAANSPKQFQPKPEKDHSRDATKMIEQAVGDGVVAHRYFDPSVADSFTEWKDGKPKLTDAELTARGYAVQCAYSTPRPAVATPAEVTDDCALIERLNGNIRQVLLDVSNGIDSPASVSMASSAVVSLDAVCAELAKLRVLAPKPRDETANINDEPWANGYDRGWNACLSALAAQCQVRKDGDGGVSEGLSCVIEWHARESASQGKLGNTSQAEMHHCYAGILRDVASPSAVAVVPEGHVTLPREELKRLRNVLAMAAHPYPSPHAEYIDTLLAAAPEVSRA